jgi:uncharacterized protein (DUF2461 family)
MLGPTNIVGHETFPKQVGEKEREGEWTLKQEPALARVPRHFVRVKDGSYIDKVLNFYISLL